MEKEKKKKTEKDEWLPSDNASQYELKKTFFSPLAVHTYPND